jgi:ferrous iron transport protein B
MENHAATGPVDVQVESSREFTVALAGNPNVGKTTLFNALTGLRQKVANYPGVTVEKKSGRCILFEGKGAAGECTIIDLPGTYSLASRSPDEHVARQVVLGQIAGTPRPDVIVVVVDASNLERNLYLVTQVLELGRPTVVALSMMDVAQQQGKRIDIEKLSRHLRAPVVAVAAHKAKENGIAELKAAIARAGKQSVDVLSLPLPEIMETHIDRLKKILAAERLSTLEQAYFDAHLMISTGEDEADGDLPDARRQHPKVRAEIAAALAACEAADVDPIGAEVEAHYAYISNVVADCFREEPVAAAISRTDRIDRIVTHRIWGMAIFVGIMALVFWSIFSWAGPAMDFLADTVVNGWIASAVNASMADGPLKSLLIDGVIAGVGNVVVFLPQIVLLFLFLAVLEDSGYMSRAAFLMDRVMSKVGLHGKSFIPLLSGYACAIPAILGTRVIENRRDRLATILILPLMSCSARLPVYALIIGAFFGTLAAWQRAGIMLSMYAVGTLTAFALAWVFKRTLLKGPPPAFILEMPPYRLPKVRVVLTTVAQRAWAFLKRAGTVIFVMSVLVWAGTHYPKPATYTKDYDAARKPLAERQEALGLTEEMKGLALAEKESERAKIPEAQRGAAAEFATLAGEIGDLDNAEGQEILEHSVAGRVGRFIAPVFAPLGYDWKLSIGVTGAFFAREVVVSTLGIVYSIGEADETSEPLKESIRADYTPLTGISLMVFVVFCMQCLPTLAIARKETGGWKWPAFMFVYMTGLAWVAAFVVYQGGMVLGLGK